MQCTCAIPAGTNDEEKTYLTKKGLKELFEQFGEAELQLSATDRGVNN